MKISDGVASSGHKIDCVIYLLSKLKIFANGVSKKYVNMKTKSFFVNVFNGNLRRLGYLIEN